MKILSTEQIREADRYTIQNEPVSSVDLMERAATQVTQWLLARLGKNASVKIFCGMGNNGGDGLVVARQLYQKGFEPKVFMVGVADRMSPDCEANFQRLQKECVITPTFICAAEDFPVIAGEDVVIDALFGSGLNRPLEGLAAELINYLNQQQAIRVAIDIPSGLFADRPSPADAVFRADYTLTFQTPKLAFFMPENDPYVGQM